MANYINDIIYFCEPFDRWHAWQDIAQLSKYNNGIVKTPERVMAGRWQWSIGKVRRYIAELTQYGVLEQIKSGRNNILKIASQYQEDNDQQSKAERFENWRVQVLNYTAGEDLEAVNQYINYWGAYSNTTQLYKFEARQDYEIETSWASWMQKRNELQTTKNNNNNGKSRTIATTSSTTASGSKPFTIAELTSPAEAKR